MLIVHDHLPAQPMQPQIFKTCTAAPTGRQLMYEIRDTNLRDEILAHVESTPATYDELAAATGARRSTVRRQALALRDAGLIHRRLSRPSSHGGCTATWHYGPGDNVAECIEPDPSVINRPQLKSWLPHNRRDDLVAALFGCSAAAHAGVPA